jgi:hypothetical protein
MAKKVDHAFGRRSNEKGMKGKAKVRFGKVFLPYTRSTYDYRLQQTQSNPAIEVEKQKQTACRFLFFDWHDFEM